MSLGVGMLFGTVPTSIPVIILSGNWLFEGRFIAKWQLIKSNKVFWILSAIFLMHLLGLIHTSDMVKGIDDLRIKIPLFVFPLVFFTSEQISKKELNFLLWFFIYAVVLSTLWCITYYFTHEMNDARKASRYMSHIRLGLFINFCIGVLFSFFRDEKSYKIKICIAGLIVYLLAVMLVLGMVTGLILMAGLCLIYFFYLIFNQKSIYRVLGLCLFTVSVLIISLFIRSEWENFNYIDISDNNTVKQFSDTGRPYYKIDNTNFHRENGFYITYNIQYDELLMQWKKRSKADLYSMDKKGTLMVWNVIRYLSSKGLTKDSAGISQLIQADLDNIERGITNYRYADASPLTGRVKEFFWEYRDYKQGFNPSGNTLLMRLEFWKAACYIIKRNVWIGVGTGDAQKAFDKSYFRTNSKLSHEWRLRSHNQFLAITVTFGVCGLMVFLLSIIYPAVVSLNRVNKLYWLFLAIAIISFITEDTLETQSGVSFFAYFNTLFLWLAQPEKKE